MLRSILAVAAAAACVGLVPVSAQAQTWNQTGGTHDWNDPANWDPANVPNGVGAVANVTNDLTSSQTINTGGITLGTLNIGDPVYNPGPDPGEPRVGATYDIYTLTAGTITFDNGASDAQINAVGNKPPVSGPGAAFNLHDIIFSTVRLNSNLVIDATHPEGIVSDLLRIHGNIVDGDNGPRGIVKTGLGWVEFRAANTYTGLTQVTGGRLRLGAASGTTLIAGDIEISGEAMVQYSFGTANHVANTSIVRFTGPGLLNLGGGLGDTVGGIEAIGPDTFAAEIGAGGNFSFGAADLDLTYDGRLGYNTSFTKIGTGVQTLGGGLHNWRGAAANTFSVLGGRVDLAKDDGLAAIAQGVLNIGDGSLSGAQRPEVRLLANEQIQVETSSVTSNPTETTEMTLNSGVFDLNGFSETVRTVVVTGSGTSTIDLGAGGNFAVVNSLTVNDFATAELTSGPGGSMTVGGLTIASSGVLDVTNSGLTVQNGDLDAIRALVASGYAGGDWDGPGINSSVAATEPGRAVGMRQVGSDVEVAFTFSGDANLDGVVNIADLSLLASNWQLGVDDGNTAHWFHGDFNYDGRVNIADLSLLASNWQAGVPAGAPMMSFADALAMFDVFNGVVIPEPASLSLLGLAGLSLLERKRRRRA